MVYGEEGIFALEVKNSSRVMPRDLRHLRAFKEDYPESHLYLLYRGSERLLKGDVLCIPFDQFLVLLNPDQSIDAAAS